MDWAFFPVNGLGLNLSNFSGGKSSEKTEMIVWNLKIDKKWVNGLGFLSKCVSSLTNKQTKKLKTREFEEKKIDRSAFGKGKTVKIREKLEKLEKNQ